ncbi:unnamed protein product [[Actinomadura] parvosata subsp. kistnae]|uniref:hypothetical protein n=1 Tax=[Actinomadura] parvosata TaxID=1955412 RepID=UPI000D2AAB5F|nr:unnamed protein product [Actinomadura parvosata subsp. kistnae]
MGRYASVDWIQFAWDEQHGGLGPGRTSLERTAGWYHQLGPWLDPGPEPGVSLCRLLVDGRVVVLARTRTGGADSRRTIRVQAYLGGSATQPMAMPNVRQTLALASGWAARLPDGDEPLDLGKLISSYDSARAALDRESRAAAPALAPIVAERLRRPRTPLSVASGGNPIVQLWGLVDILDYALGHYPETFSTYESDDLKPGAEIIFLRQWPGPSSQSSHRTRVDSRLPDQGDTYASIAAMLVDAYAQDRLVGLVKRLGITDRTPLEERLRRLASATNDSTAVVARGAPDEGDGDELVWSPQPPGPGRSQPVVPAQVEHPPPYGTPPGPPPTPASPQAPGTHVAGQTAELQRPRAAGQVAGQSPGAQQRPADTARAAPRTPEPRTRRPPPAPRTRTLARTRTRARRRTPQSSAPDTRPAPAARRPARQAVRRADCRAAPRASSPAAGPAAAPGARLAEQQAAQWAARQAARRPARRVAVPRAGQAVRRAAVLGARREVGWVGGGMRSRMRSRCSAPT